MWVTSKNEFFENYDIRYSVLLSYQLLFLFLFRILTLFISTEGLHHIQFITGYQLQLLYTILQLGFCILFLINIPRKFQHLTFFVIILFLEIFLAILYIEQFYIVTNSINLRSNDLIFISLQVLVLLILMALNSQNFKPDIKNNSQNINLYLLLSFILYLLSSLVTFSVDLSNLFLLLADVLFWVFLLSLIVKYAKILYANKPTTAIIPIVIGFFFGFGMFMGMTKNQVMRAVIITIIDQTFSLHAIQPLIYGFSFELAMIFIDVVLGFIFVAVLLLSLLKNVKLRHEITIYFIIGVTGLAVYPLLALIRFYALFSLIKKTNDE